MTANTMSEYLYLNGLSDNDVDAPGGGNPQHNQNVIPATNNGIVKGEVPADVALAYFLDPNKVRMYQQTTAMNVLTASIGVGVFGLICWGLYKVAT